MPDYVRSLVVGVPTVHGIMSIVGKRGIRVIVTGCVCISEPAF